MIARLVSGGQTGVDRAALDVALELGVPCGGWRPKGRRAEDGRIPDRYPLAETRAEDNATRTRWNVRDSDFTLVLSYGEPTGGTRLTLREAARRSRPHALIDLANPVVWSARLCTVREAIIGLAVLHVAGPRESHHPGTYDRAKALLRRLLADDADRDAPGGPRRPTPRKARSMKTGELVKLLERLGRRLETIADQAKETREQAQHTLDRLDRLRQDLDRIRLAITATAETSDSIPVTEDMPPEA